MEEIQFESRHLLIQDLWKNVKKLTKNNYPHVPGEVLLPNDPIYIHRQADDQLLNFLQNDQDNLVFCCLFSPPKCGKSSLVFRIQSKLSRLKFNSIGISLTNSSNQLSEESFYLEMLKIIYKGIDDNDKNLRNILNRIWSNNPQKHIAFIECLKEIINRLNKSLIIFIDNLENLREEKIYNYFFDNLYLLRFLSANSQDLLQPVKWVLSGSVNFLSILNKDYEFLLKHSTIIQVPPFLKNQCDPLERILKKNNGSDLLESVMYWTQGQPFLTQILCQILYEQSTIVEALKIESQIEQLVKRYCLQTETLSTVDSHFMDIHNYFINLGNQSDNLNRVLVALNLYEQIMTNSNSVRFSHNSEVHWDLLTSGLVIQSKEFLIPSNPIYQQVFDRQWIIKIKRQLNELRRSIMSNSKIYNRKVYMLIDQSGSMAKRDPLLGNERRWIKLQELIEGHVFGITNKEGMNGEKICDEITISCFSPNRAGNARPIQDDSQVADLFKENQPDGNTFIVPTLKAAIDSWFATRTPNQGGFIIIYTDGELDDRIDFEKLVKETCQKLNSQDELKIVIIGYGSDIVNRPDFYEKLDADSNTDKNGKPCDIVVFDTFDKMPNIIDVLNSQL